jgi:hypothetical protein
MRVLFNRVADPHSFHPDPDPDPAPAFEAEYRSGSNTDPDPSYRRSLQPSKKAIQHFKT